MGILSPKQTLKVLVQNSLVLALAWWLPMPAKASSYCQAAPEAIAYKQETLAAAIAGDKAAKTEYQAFVKQHGQELQRCRAASWLKNQAIWLRLYPCDLRSGALDNIMDRLVNKGYNEVYVEVLYDGQVLLPQSDNPTTFPSVVWQEDQKNADLLAMAIQKGRERGLKVYAWAFTLNYGYSYAQRGDRQQVLARNHKGQTTLEVGSLNFLDTGDDQTSTDQAFVDPYNPQSLQDLSQVVAAILKRQPDGVLFDYVRYLRTGGAGSLVSNVRDMWIYGEASMQALLQRAKNQKGQELIRRFVDQGYITAGDINAVNKLYPKEREPIWEGRKPVNVKALTASQLQPILQQELWLLSISHAFDGVANYLAQAAQPVNARGIPSGAVFFPEGNQVIRGGFDSRLQPWHRFTSTPEWHPMVYALCGRADCIAAQVKQVLSAAPQGIRVSPVLAGLWGQPMGNRPSLEEQMVGIQQMNPEIDSISHFAFAWQEPDLERSRKTCK